MKRGKKSLLSPLVPFVESPKYAPQRRESSRTLTIPPHPFLRANSDSSMNLPDWMAVPNAPGTNIVSVQVSVFVSVWGSQSSNYRHRKHLWVDFVTFLFFREIFTGSFTRLDFIFIFFLPTMETAADKTAVSQSLKHFSNLRLWNEWCKAHSKYF